MCYQILLTFLKVVQKIKKGLGTEEERLCVYKISFNNRTIVKNFFFTPLIWMYQKGQKVGVGENFKKKLMS